MKLKNRILSLLLVFCMVATLLPVSALAAERDRVQVSESTNQFRPIRTDPGPCA